MLNIYEFDHTVIPQTKNNYFEVYGEDVINPLFSSEYLDNVIAYCYNTGDNFTFHSLEAWEREHG